MTGVQATMSFHIRHKYDRIKIYTLHSLLVVVLIINKMLTRFTSRVKEIGLEDLQVFSRCTL